MARPGLDRAAQYIADRSSTSARLAGGGDARQYLQRFNIEAGLEDGAGAIIIRTATDRVAFRIGMHYYPLSIAASAATDPPVAGLVFAGYGIVATGLGYDDYAGLDVERQGGDRASPTSRRNSTPTASSRAGR